MCRDEVLGQRSETVRQANLSAIVRELHVNGPLSRSELVARTGLTRSAIRGLIVELACAGLVSEGPPGPLGTPGRPSPLVRLEPRRAVALALDIAVDSVAVALVGLGGSILDRTRIDRPRGEISFEATVAELADLARAALEVAPSSDALVRVGVAVAGVVRRTDGVVSMAPNLGWRDVPLGHTLARALQLKAPVAVANDADLGALAELRRGAAIGVEDVLFLSGEVGVGGGVIVGGKPLTGAAGYAGEVGHLPVNPSGRPCRCGSTGCWETEVGGGAILRRAGRAPDGGRAEIGAVLADAAAGRPEALDALEETGRWLGIGLAGLVNVLDPRLIVLGGLFGPIRPFIIRSLEEELDRRTLPAPRALVRIVSAALGVDAPLVGAAELAFEPLLADPALWIGPREVLSEVASA